MRTGSEAGRPAPAPSPSAEDDALATMIEGPASIHPDFAGPAPPLPDPREIGRFQVLRRLGEGGMGVVYSAYDEELGRRVAIKLLRRGLSRDPEASASLRREAQRMARVSHPNVAGVYEVGEHEGQIFIAMEFIHGVTLREWLRGPHPLRDRIAMLAQAGAGLVAAHEADLVHRDFKPDNVLVGEDGRARVVDFGLALGPTRDPEGPHGAASAPDRGADESVATLRSGPAGRSFAGTPAYMSPEQHLRESAGPQSDVFAFSVTLHEAVYGLRPFAGADAREVGAQIIQGRIRPIPSDAAVPPWLRRAILRGLAVDPQDRWPTMQALVSTLERDPGRVRRRRLAIVGAALVIGVGGLALARDARLLDSRCRGASDQLRGVWDGLAKREVKSAILNTQVAYAAQTWLRVEGELDRYAGAWVAMHNEACAATTIRGEQSAELLDLRMACLRRRLGALSAQVDVLRRAETDAVASAVAAVQRLPPLSECADPSALRSAAARDDDPERARQAERLRDDLARALAELNAAQWTVALEIATRTSEQARALGLWDVDAEAGIVAGKATSQLADYPRATALLEASFTSALAHGSDRAAAEAAIELIFVTGYFRGESDEGERWARIAEALLDRIGDEGILRALFNNYSGVILQERGEIDEALRRHEASLALLEQIGADDARLTAELNNLGVTYSQAGRTADSRRSYERALALLTAAYGDEHPNVAAMIENLGTLDLGEGKVGEAIAKYRRSLAIRRRLLDADHPQIAISLINLASAELEVGDRRGARALAEEALAKLRAAYGDDAPYVAFARSVLADALLAAEELEAARAEVALALPILRDDLTGDRTLLSLPLTVLAEIDERSGDLEAAEREITEALAIHAADPGITEADVGRTRFIAGRVRWLRGDLEAAAVDIAAAEAAYAAAGPVYAERGAAVATWRKGHAMPIAAAIDPAAALTRGSPGSPGSP